MTERASPYPIRRWTKRVALGLFALLIVLTAMAPFTPAQLKELGMTPAAGARFKQEWQSLHAEQARFSTRGRQQIVPDATHYIQFDRPDIVVAAVRTVVDAVRADEAGHTSDRR